jgi:predicted secreted hydrolase
LTRRKKISTPKAATLFRSSKNSFFFAGRYFLLILLAYASLAQAEWKAALPGWNYEFPKDHGSHSGFKTEWWYFTGNVRTQEGLEFGYQLTFFRQGIIEPDTVIPKSRFIQRDIKFAHFAVSDISSKRFRHFQKLSRGAYGEAGFDDGDRLAWIQNWSCERTGEHSFRLRAADTGIALDLLLESSTAPVIHGSNGISQKSDGPGRASHYYSLTRMKTKGSIEIDGLKHMLTGATWFDHEWATNQLAANQTGWDWFSLQLQDGSDLMLFQIRTKEGGRDPYSSGTFVSQSGESQKIHLSDFDLAPVDWWTSPHTKARYPVAWKISIPSRKLELTVRARFQDQELASQPFSYWEGSVSAEGTRDGQPVKGKGYLEMTGYSGRIIGMQAQ